MRVCARSWRSGSWFSVRGDDVTKEEFLVDIKEAVRVAANWGIGPRYILYVSNKLINETGLTPGPIGDLLPGVDVELRTEEEFNRDFGPDSGHGELPVLVTP